LLRAHAHTWEGQRRPSIEQFARDFNEITDTADETVRLDALPAQLTLEGRRAQWGNGVAFLLVERQDSFGSTG